MKAKKCGNLLLASMLLLYYAKSSFTSPTHVLHLRELLLHPGDRVVEELGLARRVQLVGAHAAADRAQQAKVDA